MQYTPPAHVPMAMQYLFCASLTKGYTTIRGLNEDPVYSNFARVLWDLGTHMEKKSDGVSILGQPIKNQTAERQKVFQVLSGAAANGNIQAIDAGTSFDATILLAVACALRPGNWQINSGTPRSCSFLFQVLRQLGATITPPTDPHKTFPVVIQGGALQGDSIMLDAPQTHAFLPALMLLGAFIPNGLDITCAQKPQNRSLWAEAQSVLNAFSVTPSVHMPAVPQDPFVIKIAAQQSVSPTVVQAESNIVPAAHACASALLAGQAITINQLPPLHTTPQEESQLFAILQDMGATITTNVRTNTITTKASVWIPQQVNGHIINLSSMPQAIALVACVCACADGPTTITGLDSLVFDAPGHIDRLRAALTSMGVQTEMDDNHDQMVVHGRGSVKSLTPGMVKSLSDDVLYQALKVLSPSNPGLFIRP